MPPSPTWLKPRRRSRAIEAPPVEKWAACGLICIMSRYTRQFIMTVKDPAHPGRMVKAEIEYLNLSVAQAAEALGVTRSQLHRVVSGRSSLSAEMALRLEAVIGSTADHWLRMQAAYDAAEVRGRAGEITKGLKRVPKPKEPASGQPSLS